MRQRKCIAGLIAVTAIYIVAGPALQAATVTATFNGLGYGGTQFGIRVKNSAGVFTDSGGAGIFNWTGVSTNPTPLKNSFTSFCIDVKDYISGGGPYTYNFSSLDSAPILNGSGQTFNTDLAGGMGANKANALSHLFGQYFSLVNSQTTAAAFQAAIWEIVYDTYTGNVSSYDVTKPVSPSPTNGFAITSVNGYTSGGDFSAVTNQANTWLQGLTLSSGPTMSLAAITSDVYQDQVVIVPTPTASMAGMGLLGGLCIVGFIKRRRNQIVLD